ncbi:MAG: DUF134 domain-containing protein [Bacteroidales bacterium]
MSPRLKIPRKVETLPPVRVFAPAPSLAQTEGVKPVLVFFEELEAFRLCDYDGLTQQQASERMGVSRPTFTRIYSSSLRKIATAIVEGRPFEFMGGSGYFNSDWHHCSECGGFFSFPLKPQEPTACPVCGSVHISRLEDTFNPDEEGDYINSCPYCGCPSGEGKGRKAHSRRKCKNCGRIYITTSD